MKKQTFQYVFDIKGLIPRQVKLKRKIWLKEGELLLKKDKGGKLQAYFLGDIKENIQNKEKVITQYLWTSCLISNNAPDVEGGFGIGISSKEKLGTIPQGPRVASVRMDLHEEAVTDIEKYAHKFLGSIRKLHDKYIDVVSENSFMELSLDYFYEAKKKFVISNEGFISAITSLESLFNEGGGDIKYKLSHRAAFILGMCDIDPEVAFEKLKTFYDKRSQLVHGGSILRREPDRNLISEYTRQSIIIFLILLSNEDRRMLTTKKRKKEILKEIDYAMLHENKRKTLKKEIRKGLKDFKLTIPRTFEGTGKHGRYRTTAW